MAEEKLPRCPANKRWLVSMYRLLGPLFEESPKLRRFLPCIAEEVEELKKRE